MKSTAIATEGRDPVGRRIKWVMVGMLVTLLAAIGATAWAQSPPGEAHGRWTEMRHGMHHGGAGGPEGMFRGSPERIGRMVDRMLDGLNASDAQRTQIKQIATAAAADLRAQAEAGRGLRERALEVFTAPTVDAAAAEQLRQQTLQQHDRMSQRVTQAMLDASRVLTPEQRAQLGTRIRDRQASRADRMNRFQEHMKSHEAQRPMEGQRR